jgi:hypothetical protein
MSLINVRNFLTPLQNKYQIGALLVIALVVAVVRVIGSSEPSQGRENLKINDDIKQFLASQQPSTQAQKEHDGFGVPSDDEILGGLMGDGGQDERSKEGSAPVDSKSNKGLSDIRKSLGLE